MWGIDLMELEFDKEMDAILRKARGGSGVFVTTAHLDADMIAAFVENALPEKTKLLNMEHFADCDRCRKQLAFAMSMNSEAEPVTAGVEPVVEAAIPWYSKLFRTPNLALAMGALVVAFSGVIGYLAIQNRNAPARSDVAQANVSKPYAGETSSGAASNSANNAPVSPAAPVASAPVNPAMPAAQPTVNAPESSTGRVDQPVASKNEPTDTYGLTDEKEEPATKPVTAEPVPVAGGQTAKTEERKDDAKLKGEDEVLADSTKAGDDRTISRDGQVMSPLKKAPGGPTRGVGPSLSQQQSNANVYNETQYRSVGGKNFDNRGGVWYDTTYNGQPMIRLTRGSAEYKKLDGSIKRIAQNLGGIVVVVWKAKAYRIQ